MMRTILFTTLALSGLLSSSPAQLHVQARLGRHVSIGSTLGDCFPASRHHHGGYWTTVTDRVWVPGGCRTVHIPACYGWITDSCGRRRWGVIHPARAEVVREPGRYEFRTRKVWVSGSGCR
jgi:hypothetical protein